MVPITKLGLTGQPWDFIGGIDINTAGRVIVGIFFVVWIGAIVYYKAAKIDERYGHNVNTGGAPTTPEPTG